MKLYLFRNSPNCRKVLATIYQLKLDVELIEFTLEEGRQKTADYLSMNPNGKTPVLDDDGFILWESNAINQYLAGKADSNTLLPDDHQRRADIIRWQFWETNHYGRAVGDILWEQFAKALFTGEASDPDALNDALNRFHQCAPILEQQLNKHPFITGDTVSLADFSTACHSGFLEMAKVPVADYPNIAQWYQRMDDVPGWSESAPVFG